MSTRERLIDRLYVALGFALLALPIYLAICGYMFLMHVGGLASIYFLIILVAISVSGMIMSIAKRRQSTDEDYLVLTHRTERMEEA